MVVDVFYYYDGVVYYEVDCYYQCDQGEVVEVEVGYIYCCECGDQCYDQYCIDDECG